MGMWLIFFTIVLAPRPVLNFVAPCSTNYCLELLLTSVDSGHCSMSSTFIFYLWIWAHSRQQLSKMKQITTLAIQPRNQGPVMMTSDGNIIPVLTANLRFSALMPTSQFCQSLGAEGVLPSRHIESFLRVFKQFTHSLPSRKLWVIYQFACHFDLN